MVSEAQVLPFPAQLPPLDQARSPSMSRRVFFHVLRSLPLCPGLAFLRSIHRMIKLGLSIDEDAEDVGDDIPPLEEDVAGQDEGSRMEDVD